MGPVLFVLLLTAVITVGAILAAKTHRTAIAAICLSIASLVIWLTVCMVMYTNKLFGSNDTTTARLGALVGFAFIGLLAVVYKAVYDYRKEPMIIANSDHRL